MNKRMDSYTGTNRQNWNERVPIHARSQMYDVAGFRAGASSLHSIEMEELGDDVPNKRLLHLQCHFGLDTLSWARHGAQVTGVDFSDAAIALAQQLSDELQIPATWICADVLALRDVVAEQYDIVYTSYGVLPWLADLQRWAHVIAESLAPGGTFYIVEDHPLTSVFGNEDNATKFTATHDYFGGSQPTRWEAGPTYTDGEEIVSTPNYEWTHSLGEVITALATAGLQIAYVHEFPLCAWRRFPWLELGADGWWHLPAGDALLPLTFSLRAMKPNV
jgi:SAM-dependent methyltransferase